MAVALLIDSATVYAVVLVRDGADLWLSRAADLATVGKLYAVPDSD